MIHTSDWHLGKHLKKLSRIEEQRAYIEEFIGIVEAEQADIVIIAGDIYDTVNPSAEAEQLYFYALKQLTKQHDKLVIIVSGNHDSPKRLYAPTPFLFSEGVIISHLPNQMIPTGDYSFYQIIQSDEGFIEVLFKGERVRLLLMPFPSESRLNLVFTETISYGELCDRYVDIMQALLQKNTSRLDDNGINVLVSHLYAEGAVSAGERHFDVGGSRRLPPYVFPDGIQYVALGHLHRPQKVKYQNMPIYYAGSPLQYTESEMGQKKLVYAVEITKGERAKVREIFLKSGKPIVRWAVQSVDEAMALLTEKRDERCYAILEIHSEKSLTPSEIRAIRTMKKDILYIEFHPAAEEMPYSYFDVSSEVDVMDAFSKYYRLRKDEEASEELLTMFKELLDAGEGEDDG